MVRIKLIIHSTFATTLVLFTQSGSKYGNNNPALKTYHLYVNYFTSTNDNKIYYNITSRGKDSIPVVRIKYNVSCVKYRHTPI